MGKVNDLSKTSYLGSPYIIAVDKVVLSIYKLNSKKHLTSGFVNCYKYFTFILVQN